MSWRSTSRNCLPGRRYKGKTITVERLWECIQEAWHEAVTPEKIETAFRLLNEVKKCVIKNNGGSNFKLPHTGIRKQLAREGWADMGNFGDDEEDDTVAFDNEDAQF